MIIIFLLTIATIIIITVFLNWYANQKDKKVVTPVGYCKINRYEKKQYKQLKLWEINDRLNRSRPVVSVYDLPDSIAEEIINYSLKLLEENRK